MTVVMKPDLPSTVVHILGEKTVTVPPSGGKTVAILAPANWGPLPSEADGKKVYASLPQVEADYGNDDSPLRTAVIGALLGTALPGVGGAGGVVIHRLAVVGGAGGAARASKAVQNTTPAAAFTFEAKWTGTRGNDLSYVIEDDPVDAAKDRFRVLFKGATVEQFSYPAADIQFLVDSINRRSSWGKATGAVVTGTALGHVAGTALVGGADGAAYTTAEVLEAQGALEFREFGIVSVAGLTDVAIKVQLATWVKTMADEMRPVRIVFGGAAGETLDDAMTELDSNPALRDPHVVRFAVGTWHDEVTDMDLSTAQLAPQVAGILAARGEGSSLTRAEMANLSMVGSTGPTSEELRVGRDAGLTMLRRVSSAKTDLAISQGVTTYIEDTETQPRELWGEPRIVGLFDRIIRQMVAWGDDVVIGDLPVTPDTRSLVQKEMLKILGALEDSGLAKAGTAYVVVQDPEDPALADAIPYDFGFIPTRTSNYLIGNGKVR